MGTITITRRSLYDQVWSEPMLHLATRYGLSNVGLAKICRKHNIPRPPCGYWAKMQSGKKPRQTPLPKPGQDHNIEIREHVPPSLQQPLAEARVEKPVEPKITVAETLRGAHELVSRANQQLRSARADGNGLIIVPADPALDIQVSKASLHRALLIMDALLKAAQQRGCCVAAGPSIEIEGVGVRIHMKELLETVRDEPVEPELKDGEYTFGHSRFTERAAPCGRLVLSLTEAHHCGTPGWRHAWRDNRCPLENRLNSVLHGIVDLAQRERERQAEQRRYEQERRKRERQLQEEARQRAEGLELVRTERRRVECLLREADNWKKSRDLRGYIEARRQKHLAVSGATEPSGEFAQWLDWATQQADRLDPLAENQPSILDENAGREDDSCRAAPKSWCDK